MCVDARGFQTFVTWGAPVNNLFIHGTPELLC